MSQNVPSFGVVTFCIFLLVRQTRSALASLRSRRCCSGSLRQRRSTPGPRRARRSAGGRDGEYLGCTSPRRASRLFIRLQEPSCLRGASGNATPRHHAITVRMGSQSSTSARLSFAQRVLVDVPDRIADVFWIETVHLPQPRGPRARRRPVRSSKPSQRMTSLSRQLLSCPALQMSDNLLMESQVWCDHKVHVIVQDRARVDHVLRFMNHSRKAACDCTGLQPVESHSRVFQRPLGCPS